MALNTSRKTLILQRRQLVARARLRGFTLADICRALEGDGHLNPMTGKAWSEPLIHSDLKAIEKEWREEMLRDTSEHKARILAELAEIKRKGWSDNDVEIVLKALTQERAVIGADAPQKIDLNVQQEIESLLTELTALRTTDASTESSTLH